MDGPLVANTGGRRSPLFRLVHGPGLRTFLSKFHPCFPHSRRTSPGKVSIALMPELVWVDCGDDVHL